MRLRRCGRRPGGVNQVVREEHLSRPPRPLRGAAAYP